MHHRPTRKKRKANQSKPASPDFQTRMRMVGFTQSKTKFLELLQRIEIIEKDLVDFRQRINQAAASDGNRLTTQIRELEDQRFLLLSQLYGNRIQYYRQ